MHSKSVYYSAENKNITQTVIKSLLALTAILTSNIYQTFNKNVTKAAVSIANEYYMSSYLSGVLNKIFTYLQYFYTAEKVIKVCKYVKLSEIPSLYKKKRKKWYDGK